ncbi:MAG: hypothetical protein ABSB88_12220 [Bryobacteraceae bacterium]
MKSASPGWTRNRRALPAKGAKPIRRAVNSTGRGILVGLDRAGTMPAGSRVDPVNFGNDLAAVNAKLAGMVVAAR